MSHVARAAAVSNALGRKREERQQNDLLRNGIIEKRLVQADQLIRKRFNKAYKKNQVGEEEDESLIRPAALLLREVEDRIQATADYRNLFFFCFFVCIYVGVLWQQRDVLTSYNIEKTHFKGVIPKDIDTAPQYWSWLRGIVNMGWFSAICGDGICSAPTEFPGFGRFGCIPDCGRYKNLTHVKFSSGAQLHGQKVGFGGEIAFSFKVFSHTMNDWMFLGRKDLSNGWSLVEKMPDGKYDVYLYQHQRLEDQYLQVEQIFADMGLTNLKGIKPGASPVSFADAHQVMLAAAARAATATESGTWTGSTTSAAKILHAFSYGVNMTIEIPAGPGRTSSALASTSLCSVDISKVATVSVGGQTKYDLESVLSQFNASGSCKQSFSFSLWNKGAQGRTVKIADSSAAAVRYLTTNNQLVGGLEMFQSRKKTVMCDRQHFKTPQICRTSVPGNLSPIGVDPFFLPTSSLFDPTLTVDNFYNKSELRTLNSIAVPYGFYPSVDKSDDKLRIFLDNDMSLEQALNVITVMEEGFWFDHDTSSSGLRAVTYNSNLDMFSLILQVFNLEEGGSFTFSYRLTAFSLSPYGSDAIRKWFLEILFLVMLLISIVLESKSIVSEGLRKYVSDFWNVLDWLSIFLMVSLVIGRGVFLKLSSDFTIESNYSLLKNVKSAARITQTDDANIGTYLKFMADMEWFADFIFAYSVFAGINLILLVLRILKLMDFQARLGLVTRTLGRAFTDLGHFLLLFSVVFMGFAAAGVLLFGHQMEKFSTFQQAAIQCMMMLLALDAPYKEMALASSPSVVAIYYWSWVLFGIFILLNIFLAILIDSYSEIKSEAQTARTIPAEVADRFKNFAEDVRSKMVSNSTFVSDAQLRQVLQKYTGADDSSSVLIAAPEDPERSTEKTDFIDLPEGLVLTVPNIANILKTSSFGKRGGRKIAPSPDQAAGERGSLGTNGSESVAVPVSSQGSLRHVGEDSPDTAMATSMAENLVERFSYLLDPEDDDEELLRHIEAENLQRQLQAFKTQSVMEENISKVLSKLVGVEGK